LIRDVVASDERVVNANAREDPPFKDFMNARPPFRRPESKRMKIRILET